ncbi:MAG: response regulator [Pirellulales bacterium]|nr:response regulator [Pirellulales bacterium]
MASIEPLLWMAAGFVLALVVLWAIRRSTRAASAEPEARQPAVAPNRSTNGGRRRIVYIDDGSALLAPVESKLAQGGFDVLAVDSDQLGYWTCVAEAPDVVLLAMARDNRDAESVVAQFQENPLTREIPLVIVAGRGHALFARRTALPPGYRLLEAPVAANELLSALRAACPARESTPAGEPSASGGSDHDRRRTTPAASQRGPASGEEQAYVRFPEGVSDAAVRARPMQRVFADHADAGGDLLTVPDNTDNAATPRPGEHPRPVVLCVDDDPDVSRAIAVRLRQYGVDVVRAFSGTQGFWMGLDYRPDVIIIDLRMPEGEGDYLFGRFQSHALTKDVPVIVLTGVTNPGVKRQMLSLGAAAYLTKPVVFDELLRELRPYIALPQTPAAASPPGKAPLGI